MAASGHGSAEGRLPATAAQLTHLFELTQRFVTSRGVLDAMADGIGPEACEPEPTAQYRLGRVGAPFAEQPVSHVTTLDPHVTHSLAPRAAGLLGVGGRIAVRSYSPYWSEVEGLPENGDLGLQYRPPQCAIFVPQPPRSNMARESYTIAQDGELVSGLRTVRLRPTPGSRQQPVVQTREISQASYQALALILLNWTHRMRAAGERRYRW